MTMAGARLADISMDEAYEKLYEAINKHRKEESNL